MKLNLNKLCYLILGSIAIGLCSVLSGLLLLTHYEILKYIALGFTYLFGCYFLKTSKKYKLFIEKRS